MHTVVIKRILNEYTLNLLNGEIFLSPVFLLCKLLTNILCHVSVQVIATLLVCVIFAVCILGWLIDIAWILLVFVLLTDHLYTLRCQRLPQ